MQEVLIEDVLNAAAAIADLPPPRRHWVAMRMVAEAAAADKYRRKTGRAHPRWGDGSLMTAARRRPCAASRRLTSAGFRRALCQVIEMLGVIYPDAQETHIGCVGSASRRPVAISSPQSVQ